MLAPDDVRDGEEGEAMRRILAEEVRTAPVAEHPRARVAEEIDGVAPDLETGLRHVLTFPKRIECG
tara:strand:- start:397 stop:594 length:198 start_codon:yes stop_codon:yes gene_type:complete